MILGRLKIRELKINMFYQREVSEEYIYCVEDDEFGITYHRFEKTDYEL